MWGQILEALHSRRACDCVDKRNCLQLGDDGGARAAAR